MSYTLADGQLAASSATVLAADTRGTERRVTVTLHNTSDSASETWSIAVSRGGGTARVIVRGVLGPKEGHVVTGLPLAPSDVVTGSASDASTVDYFVGLAGDVPFDSYSLDASGVRKQTSAGTAETAAYALDLASAKTWDAHQTNIPGTPANDDLGLVTGTFLTDAPTLQSGDAKAATVSRKAGFFFRVPPEYVAGGALTLRLNAGMLTTVSDGTATIDAEVARQAAPTVDLCATNAQSINSLTAANKDFTLTPTNVVPGDLLLIVVTIAITDGATATAVIGVLNAISVRASAKI